jgi:hypothetical protein
MRNFFLVIVFLITFPQSLAAQRVNVSVFPNEIDQLGKYVIVATNPDGTPFTGYLQVQYWLCPLGAKTHDDPGCVGPRLGSQFYIPPSGKSIQNLALYPHYRGWAVPVAKHFQMWKPASGNYEWSNETSVTVTPLDMKRYFNLKEGNFYIYDANNLKTGKSFINTPATRLDIKEETICGERTTSMFFSKTTKYAYWNPSYEVNDWTNTDRFLVWRPRWNEKGELETKTWSEYRQDYSFPSLNTFPSDRFSFERMVRQIYHYGVDYSTKTPFPPYVYTLDKLDLNQYSGPDREKWYLMDQICFKDLAPQPGESENQFQNRFCQTAPSLAAQCSGFHTVAIMKYYAKIIDTPTYKGPAVAVVMREAPKERLTNKDCKSINDFPQKCPEVLREDWFMAKDIGLVRIETKNFGGIYGTDPNSPSCANDPDCTKDGPMSNPWLVQNLISYRVSYPQEKYLSIKEETSKTRVFTISLNRNDFSDLNFLSTLTKAQLVIDDDTNWHNGYGLRVMVILRDHERWKTSNSVNGVYYVYEPELGGPAWGWQSINVNSAYTHQTNGFKVKLEGLLYDGEDLIFSIRENDGGKGFSLNGKNIYLYLEGEKDPKGVVPLFAQGPESYYGFTFAKIGKFIPSIIPGDINGDGKVDFRDIKILLSSYLSKDPKGDLNEDEKINSIDFGEMIK